MRLNSRIDKDSTMMIVKIERKRRPKLSNLKILKQDLTLFLNSYQLIQDSLLLPKLNPSPNITNKKHKLPSQTRVTVSSSISVRHKTNHPHLIRVSI